jgi:amidase
MSDLHELTLTEVAAKIQSREVSAVEVTDGMLARIERLDGELMSYATVMAAVAKKQAADADKEIANGNVKSILHGVPFGLKDLCATKDGPTHVGSIALRNWNPGVDSTVVAKLRDAGTVFLGKLQMTEGAYAVHHPDITPPLNPWNADYWTGVSSSGSGVATAARLCYGSLGTDTGGSIRFPSHCCGVTGLKPTWGRVSRANAFALSETLDHIGPMARSAADCAAILQIIAGSDPKDPTALQASVPRYLDSINAGIKGMTIGIDQNYCSDGVESSVSEMVMTAVEILKDRGAIIKPVSFPDATVMVERWNDFCGADTALAHESYYDLHRDKYGPVLSSLIEVGRNLSGVDHARIQIERDKFVGSLNHVFEDIDTIIIPSQPYPTPTNAFMDTLGEEEGSVEKLISFTAPHDMAGTPAICLPGGFDANDIPFGFQIVGPKLSEEKLLQAGHAYQQDTDWHKRIPPIN